MVVTQLSGCVLHFSDTINLTVWFWLSIHCQAPADWDSQYSQHFGILVPSMNIILHSSKQSWAGLCQTRWTEHHPENQICYLECRLYWCYLCKKPKPTLITAAIVLLRLVFVDPVLIFFFPRESKVQTCRPHLSQESSGFQWSFSNHIYAIISDHS